MGRTNVRGLVAWVAASAGLGACGAPPQHEQPRPAPRVAARAVENSAPAGRAEQRLPEVDTSRVPNRALVLGRQELQLAQHSGVEQSGRLLDGDVSSAAVVAPGATIRLRVGVGVIASLRVFGSTEGLVELRSLQRGAWQHVDFDLRTVQRNAGRWRTIGQPQNDRQKPSCHQQSHPTSIRHSTSVTQLGNNP